jgi:ABC-type branched-subunit amino acid transport system substrate-binding protein
VRRKVLVLNIVAIIALILSIFSGVIVTGCTGGGGGGGGNATEWDIPVMTITSGLMASAFSEAWWAMQAAANYVNANGGIAGKNISLTLYPCGSDVASAVSAAGAIIDAKPLIALLWVSPDQLTAIEPAFYGANLTAFGLTMVKPLYTSYGSKLVTFTVADFGAAVGTPTLWLGDANSTYAVDVRNVTVAYDTAGQAAYATIANALAAEINLTGRNATVKTYSSTGVLDWGPIVSPWLAEGWDAYLPVGTFLGVGGIFNKMYQLGFNNTHRFMQTFMSAVPQIFGMTTNNMTGSYYEMIYNPTYPGALWQTQYAASKAARGVEPYMHLWGGFNAILMLKAAIAASGITGNAANLTTERPQLLSAYRNMTTVDGITGPINMYHGFTQVNNFLFEAAGNNTLLTSRLVGSVNYTANSVYTYYNS